MVQRGVEGSEKNGDRVLIYLIALLPAVCAWALSPVPSEAWPPLVWAAGAVVMLQHGVNVLNDVVDGRRGADVEKPRSWLQFYRGSAVRTAAHGLVLWLGGSILGGMVLIESDRLWIFWIAVPLAALGFLYNFGIGRPLSYTRWGEVLTGICCGPGIFGCFCLLVDVRVGPSFVAGCVAFGLLAVSVLLSHQPAQVLTDALVGKRTFAVRYGARKARAASRVLRLAAAGLLVGAVLSRE